MSDEITKPTDTMTELLRVKLAQIRKRAEMLPGIYKGLTPRKVSDEDAFAVLFYMGKKVNSKVVQEEGSYQLRLETDGKFSVHWDGEKFCVYEMGSLTGPAGN